MMKALLLMVCLVTVVPVVAQTPQLAYDAITIKPNDSGTDNTSTSMGESTFQATNVGLKRLLVRAYGVRAELISGLPDWANSARFDVNAKVVDPDPAMLKKLTPEQRRGFILALLKERFHLEAHIELKTLPVYELQVTKDGPKFKAAAADEEQSMGTDVSGGDAQLTANSVTMGNMAGLLTNQTDRTVIDRTGVVGKYDLKLKWTVDRRAGAQDNGAAREDVPTMFTALQEQLGLKLQPAKGPVETLVVDKVDRPTAN